MPELPDLQVFSRNLDKKLSGKKLRSVVLQEKKHLETPAAAFKKALENQTLESVYRSGKELRFVFSGGTVLGMHLMLHGKLYLFQQRNEQKYTILELLFDDGTGLALTDFQRSARASLNPEESGVPDALSKQFTLAYLKEQLAATRSNVKKLLLDQQVVRGIGNAYADEILWAARLSPFSVSKAIPAPAVKQLWQAVGKVLKEAEKKIRRSNPDIIAGEVRDFMLVHHPHKKESPGGAVIEQQSAGGRKTYYTGEQVLYQ